MTNPYIRLMRLDKPIGIFLLWYPTAWALWVANQGMPNLLILGYFIIGTVVMRSAGCVANDLADRNIDNHVSRTELRPLAAGELVPKQAVILLLMLLTIALSILFLLPKACVYYAIIAVMLTLIYPLCKRFIDTPQVVLGFAFSMGIPMAYAASGFPFDTNGWLLFLINILWIIAYDTLYAMADKVDDLKIGVKSTAIFFGDYDRVMVIILQIVMHALWLLLGYFIHLSWVFYLGWVLGIGALLVQHWTIRDKTPQVYFKAFLLNNYYGLVMWLTIIVSFNR